jgi:hypothetical protein
MECAHQQFALTVRLYFIIKLNFPVILFLLQIPHKHELHFSTFTILLFTSHGRVPVSLSIPPNIKLAEPGFNELAHASDDFLPYPLHI